MLDLLQKSGNPHYQLYDADDFHAYEERCREKDPEGYKVIFPENDELEEHMELMPNDNPEKMKYCKGHLQS